MRAGRIDPANEEMTLTRGQVERRDQSARTTELARPSSVVLARLDAHVARLRALTRRLQSSRCYDSLVVPESRRRATPNPSSSSLPPGDTNPQVRDSDSRQSARVGRDLSASPSRIKAGSFVQSEQRRWACRWCGEPCDGEDCRKCGTPF